MFYLPYEHGTKALYLLTEFEWLKGSAHALHNTKQTTADRLSQQRVVSASSNKSGKWSR